MSSNAVKIKKPKTKPKSNKISQSIPAHFYKNYIPPRSPKINPMKPQNKIPDFAPLPMTSPNTKGIDIKVSGSYSMKRNQHPMSMPVRHGFMGPNRPFAHISATTTKNDTNINKSDQKDDAPSSLEKNIRGLKVGSFTCFDVLQNNPLKPINDNQPADDNDAPSATSGTASTFASDKPFDLQQNTADNDLSDVDNDNNDNDDNASDDDDGAVWGLDDD